MSTVNMSQFTFPDDQPVVRLDASVAFQLLGSQAQLSVYTGYSMGAKYVPLNQSALFAADALALFDTAVSPQTHACRLKYRRR